MIQTPTVTKGMKLTLIILENLPMQGGNATNDAFHVREKFKDYFNSEIGSVSWQDGII